MSGEQDNDRSWSGMKALLGVLGTCIGAWTESGSRELICGVMNVCAGNQKWSVPGGAWKEVHSTTEQKEVMDGVGEHANETRNLVCQRMYST